MVVAAAARRGLLVLTAGDRILRLAPPLVATPAHVDEFVDLLRGAIVEVGVSSL